MCGICGIIDASGTTATVERVRAMTEHLRHRGPDDSGVLAAGGAALGHARLSILDLSPAGRQPMTALDGRVAMVFNGEIYNFRELRDDLAARGHSFRSQTDSEVVLAAYLEWGLDALPRLDGMFAIAVWDARTEELHLARDRFGIKPLYYAAGGGVVAFGSEIKAILAAQPEARSLDWDALAEYLWFGNPLGPRTIYRGVTRVQPGECLTFRGGARVRRQPFWRLEDVTPVDVPFEEAAAEVRRLLERAVRAHLVADVPVGVFLSGGIDSSALAAFAAREVTRLPTYSAGFDYAPNGDELPKARRLAQALGTDHHEIHIDRAELRPLLERLVRSHDEPFADPANVPLFLLCEQLGGQVKVVLQGDGGDEMFGGYRRYRALRRERVLRAAAAVAPALVRGMAGEPGRRAGRFLAAFAPADPAVRMALLLSPETLASAPTRVLTPAARAALADVDPFAEYRACARRFAALDPVQRMLYTDVQIQLPTTYFEKVDKSTMAHGVEVRVPFLDRALAEYALGLPSHYKVARGEHKRVLRAALRGVVPDEVLDAPKVGFDVPYREWLRGPLAGSLTELLADPSMRDWGVVDVAAAQRLAAEHVSGARDHAPLLWKLLQLALWRSTIGREVAA